MQVSGLAQTHVLKEGASPASVSSHWCPALLWRTGDRLALAGAEQGMTSGPHGHMPTPCAFAVLRVPGWGPAFCGRVG